MKSGFVFVVLAGAQPIWAFKHEKDAINFIAQQESPAKYRFEKVQCTLRGVAA